MKYLSPARVLTLGGLLALSAVARPLPAAEPWPFDIAVDLEAKSPLDLRGMNETVAGQHGFIRMAEDGESYVRGDGQPIRFWGVAASVGERSSDEDLARHARFLARMGCNAVRVGGASTGLLPQAQGAPLDEPDRAFVDSVWRTVAHMKKEGIYTRVAPFWDHGHVKYINPDWGFEGYQSGDSLNGLLCFMPQFQQAWKNWMRRLFTEPNPYTGIPLRDDPAVNVIQVVSEDSILFFFVDRIKGGPRKRLEGLFAEFARAKHGSLEKALSAWGAPENGDAPGEDRLALRPLYSLFQPGDLRSDDQTEFLARLERGFYAEASRFLKEELGVRAVVNASNFGPAAPDAMGALQRWIWTAADAIEFNSFYRGAHAGPTAVWRIDPGDFFTDRSAFHDWELPNFRITSKGHPFHMSSTTWTLPNRHTAEGPLLLAAYGAMHGLDAIYQFSATAPAYDAPFALSAQKPDRSSLKTWSLSHPGYLSQFPAASAIFRLGLIDEAETVIREVFSPEEMFRRKYPLMSETPGYSPAAPTHPLTETKAPLAARVSADAFLVGRVTAEYGGRPEESAVRDLAPFVDREAGVVRSTHGQLVADKRRRILAVDAPRAQGVAGFLKEAGRHFALRDVELSSENEYAVLIAVALDGLPLRDSRKILVQAGVPCRPTGWETKPAMRKIKANETEGQEIVSVGRLPWLAEPVLASMVLRNPHIARAAALDASLAEDRPWPVERRGDGTCALALPENALYLLLTAEN